MDDSKQKASSSSSSTSSIALELFGPKDTPPASSHPSSTGIFGSVFGPHSMGRGTESSYLQGMDVKYGGGPCDNGIAYQQQTNIQPWNYNSSIYYGGQEVYSTSSVVDAKHEYKKDGQDDVSDGNHAQGSASRGNWWQGSLYY